MDFEVDWTEPAAADLEAIVFFVAEHSPQAAEAVRVAILETVEVPGRFPLIGPV
jgi:plasmid stabilization system protein ParE